MIVVTLCSYCNHEQKRVLKCESVGLVSLLRKSDGSRNVAQTSKATALDAIGN